MLEAGLKLWNSPDVLPWSAWVERELDAARARGDALPRRLSASEEWLLWREAVHEACTGLEVLMPDALIEPVRRAIGRLDDYGLSLTSAATAESAVLLQARAGFRRRSDELNALGTTSWRDCSAHLQPSSRLLLAGFTALGPARRRWLEQHGARVAADSPVNNNWPVDGGSPVDGDPMLAADGVLAADVRAGADAAAVRVVGCDSPLLEAEAAAQWCAAELQRDSRARLLLVVPRLAQQRHLWERALSQRLDFVSLLTAGTSAAESPFAMEGGQALSAYPLVATALQLIAIASGPAQFEQLSAVLRSPYLAAIERNQCLRLDLWLREHNVGELQSEMLPRLVASVSAGLDALAAAALQSLVAAIQIGDRLSAATPAAWAQAFVQVLVRCGWPGGVLGSDEQQVRMRFDELLGEFAAIAAPAGNVSLRATSGAAIPAAMSPRPAGSANSAGR